MPKYASLKRERAQRPDTGTLTVPLLRELFRNIQTFRVLYETEGIDEITSADGVVISLWDVEYLLKQVDDLPPKMEQAIKLGLVAGLKEREVGELFGYGPGERKSVMINATLGLEEIVDWVNDGRLPRFWQGFGRRREEAV